MTDFVAGGAVPVDSLAYVPRPFESTCFDQLAAGRWVLLLGPRQHGKTSALARLKQRLSDDGLGTALIDVQRYAGSVDDYSSFVRWFTLHTATALGGAFVEPPSEMKDDLETCLGTCLSKVPGDLILLIDEAAGVPTALRVRFFSQLRSLYNARALADRSDWRRRLNLLFAGTFSPEGVIAGDNSPFNVSVTVYSEDLTLAQARSLAQSSAVGAELVTYVDRAFEVVGGQPYLLQRVLDVVSAGADAATRDKLFVVALDDISSGRDRHIPAMLARLATEPGAAEVARSIAENSAGVPLVSGMPHDVLPVLGIARVDANRLLIRNELYRQVVLSSPQFNPESTTGSTASPLIHPGPAHFACVKDATLSKLAYEAYASGVDSANKGHLRIALVAFGACYEGLLLDFLTQRLTANELAAAARNVKSRGQSIDADPHKWTFESMITVADRSQKLPFVKAALSNMIRDWRNLVHPEKAARNYQEQEALAPEVSVAVAAVEKLIQALEALP